MKNLIYLAIFLAGCVTALVVEALVPTANAKVEKQWEYLCEALDRVDKVRELTEKGHKRMNELGKQGWKFSYMEYGYNSCFIRLR